MQSATLRSVVAVATSLQLGLGVGVGLAASPVIGTAMGGGTFRVDHAMVQGSAELVEGSTLETGGSASAVELAGGARLSLAAASRGRVYEDRLVLEQGESRLDRASGLNLEALGLTIQAAQPDSRGRVSLEQDRRVQVAALSGSFRVLNASGQLVANLPPGVTLAFQPQAAAAASQVTGCLQNQAGHYLLTDEVTNLIVEVSGAGLNSETGNRVEVVGAADPAASPVEPASQLIRVTRVRRLAGGCDPNGAIAAAGGTAAGSGAGGGITTATVAIIGGVAAAATIGGLAATDNLPGQGDDSPAPVSR